ncbi:hypothetical protein WI23_23815 [Burkholderia oklahomensis C6786]|nr:hypothetical protein WI23_23815 [Burkholderia oklahomensis C6786]KUY50550.1 hypothetical protein WI23_27430 [Burkholderia oklahomensis C6786]KUY51648.1 hypothetical protein WG70_15240 [Burkholderia oklahomensis EO147]
MNVARRIGSRALIQMAFDFRSGIRVPVATKPGWSLAAAKHASATLTIRCIAYFQPREIGTRSESRFAPLAGIFEISRNSMLI